jgi:hypothetical protein
MAGFRLPHDVDDNKWLATWASWMLPNPLFDSFIRAEIFGPSQRPNQHWAAQGNPLDGRSLRT